MVKNKNKKELDENDGSNERIIAGIFFTENDIWHEQRRFTLRYLRDYGFGRRLETLEMEIQVQIAQYIDMVKNGPKYEHEKVRNFI